MSESELVSSLAGCRITRAEWVDEDHGGQGDDQAWIWLDDGRVIQFSSWGHDWWGATVEAVELVDVADCLHCHQPHPETRVFRFKNGKGYAYCTDGDHRSMYLNTGDK